MLTINELFELIDSPNKEQCIGLYEDNKSRFAKAQGSSHNHQAWPGGYLDHIVEVMNIAVQYFNCLSSIRELPFSLSDALLVLFVHDLEKPWKGEIHFQTKRERMLFRNSKIEEYKLELSPSQLNAIKYIEGEGNDYSSSKRIMNELAAFCHICDVTSARIWHDKPESRR